MNNGQVELDGVIIPYCEEGGEKWYPIKYVVEQFLLKGYNAIHNKYGYDCFVKRYEIDYTFKGTASQKTYCMNKDGWIKYLSECKLNKNKDDNKLKRHNIFCDYIGCDNNKYNMSIAEKPIYDDYMNDCINNVLSENKDIEFRKCPKCGREFPIHGNFFPYDKRVPSGFTGVCKMCKPSCSPIVHADKYARRVYIQYGNEGYLEYIKDSIKFIENHNEENKFKQLNFHASTKPYIKIAEKEALLNIIKDDYINKKLTVENLNVEFVLTNYKIKVKNSGITNNEINEYCSDNDCKLRPWKYPKYKLGTIDFIRSKEIIHKYIDDNKIVIENIFTYNYNELLHGCKLTQFLDNILDFVVKYYEYKYAGYKFKIASKNYYKDKNNRIFDMKWLIEKDLKIEITKIPLYVTKFSLKKHSESLYNTLRNKNYYNNSLFEWINDCYPNKFIELDFDINPYRSVFDSLEEAQVDEQIRNRVGNIIHNERNNPNTINIKGMMPDWLLCLDNGLWLIEYFGLAKSNTNDINSTNVRYYKDKVREKKLKYGQLLKVGYKHLYIYPEDLRGNFEGLHRKLDSVLMCS